MSTKRFTCGAPSASANAARSSLQRVRAEGGKEEEPVGREHARRLGEDAARARTTASARFEKTSSTRRLGERQALRVGADERRVARAEQAPPPGRAPAGPREHRRREVDPEDGGRGKALRQRVERMARAAAKIHHAAGRQADRVEVLEEPRADLALQDGRLVVGASRPARRRGARHVSPGAAASSMHRSRLARPCSASRAARRFGVAHERQVRGLGDLDEPRERQGACEPAAGADRRECVARAVDHRPGGRSPRPRRAGRRRAAGEPRREGRRPMAFRARRAARPARACVRAPAGRPARSGSRRRGRSSRDPCEVPPRNPPASRAPSRAASRRAGRSRAWCSRGPASPTRDGCRVARRIATNPPRDQPQTRAPAGEHGATARRGVEAPRRQVARMRHGRAGRRGAGGSAPRAARRARTRRRRAVPSRAGARGPGPLPSRSTCSVIAKDLAQGRGQRDDLLAGMRGREGHARRAPCRRAPWAGGSPARGGPSSRRRAESATARAASPTITGWIAVGGDGLDAVARAGAAELADALVQRGHERGCSVDQAQGLGRDGGGGGRQRGREHIGPRALHQPFDDVAARRRRRRRSRRAPCRGWPCRRCAASAGRNARAIRGPGPARRCRARRRARARRRGARRAQAGPAGARRRHPC